jgi:hypothetical protein
MFEVVGSDLYRSESGRTTYPNYSPIQRWTVEQMVGD